MTDSTDSVIFEQQDMDVQEVLKYIDELVFAQTGKHLDNLQMAILKGVLKGQKYTQIAKEYKCTAGHAKDEAYELWRILSEALGEDLNKSNFRATIERWGFANFQSPIFRDRVKVNRINFCSNPSQAAEPSQIEKSSELVSKESTTPVANDNATVIEAAQRKAKLQTVPQLAKLGLTAEQIAQALELPLDEVQQVMP